MDQPSSRRRGTKAGKLQMYTDRNDPKITLPVYRFDQLPRGAKDIANNKLVLTDQYRDEAQNQIRVNLRTSAVLVFLRVHSCPFAVIDALAARYDDPDFWNRAVIEPPDDSLA